LKRSLKLINKHLQSRDIHEPWCLNHFQRLNTAGHDFKGQMSTAYGQSGFGLTFNLDVDFGGLVGPFVHLAAGLELSGARTAHTLVLIQRCPSKVWAQHVDRPPQPREKSSKPAVAKNGKARRNVTYKFPHRQRPVWTSSKPIALAHMRGETWDVGVNASAAAWAGLGNAFDNDETGAAVGAKIEGGASGVRTWLGDNQWRNYESVYGSALSNDVDDLFENNLKKKAAAWITMAGDSIKGAREEGTPITPPRNLLNKYANRFEATVLETMDAWDTQDTQAIDRNVGGILQTTYSALRGAYRKIKTAWPNNPSTEDVKTELGKSMEAFSNYYNQLIVKELARDDELRAMSRNWGANWDALFEEEMRKTLDIAVLRMKEAQTLMDALDRAKARKDARKSHKTGEVGGGAEPRKWYILDLATHEGHCSLQGGFKVVLPAALSGSKKRDSDPDNRTKRRRLTLTGEVGGYSKRAHFRFQFPTPPKSSRDKTLYTTQDTIVAYHFWKVTAEATAGRTEHRKTPYVLATMHYRSVNVTWFRDRARTHQQTLPNGSGISFGLSVLLERLIEYADEVGKIHPARQAGSLPRLGGSALEVENLLLERLRVSIQELRDFAISIPDWLREPLEFGDAFVVESAFAMKQQFDLPNDSGRLKSLLDLPQFKQLHERSQLPDGMALQSIRLRYRNRSDADRTRNLFTLGLNPQARYSPENNCDPKDFAEDARVFDQFTSPSKFKWLEKFVPSALQLQLGIGLERVTRVGTEGIFTVHERIFPDPYPVRSIADGVQGGYKKEVAEAFESRRHRANSEYRVPPVQLFSQ